MCGASLRTLWIPIATALGAFAPSVRGQCPAWQAGFGQPGMLGSVNALAEHDDGSGPALYVGGTFTSAGGVSASNIAKWDGERWWPLGQGLTATAAVAVLALAVYDDGTGAALYAGGVFTSAGGTPANHIAKWHNGTWTALASGVAGVTSPSVRSLVVHDDGAGSALYVGGTFTDAAGVVGTRGLARWTGAWSAVGGGTNGSVWALATHDDAGGRALYAGGIYSIAGSTSAANIARWRSSSWSALGTGVVGSVLALTEHDDGVGRALYAGGQFTSAGGVPGTSRIARWRASAWSALATGTNGTVRALTAYDDGAGPALHAGGEFTSPASRVVKWSNSGTWSALGPGLDGTVSVLLSHDDGSGPALFAGGMHSGGANAAYSNVAKWRGGSWYGLGDGLGGNTGRAFATYDDGSGAALFLGGFFTHAGGVSTTRIARWNGAMWSALGSGVSGGSFPSVHALAVYDDGGAAGSELFVGGMFTTAGGLAVGNIAKWNGTWVSIPGVSGTAQPVVAAFAVYEDGASGPTLYVGGAFTSAGGLAAESIARWNGSWSALPGVGGAGSLTIHALAVHDAGSGAALFAGGSFSTAGGASALNVARWNGSSWSALGMGLDNTVIALCAYDDGTGAALYAGGTFTLMGGRGIAKWDGSTWSLVGGGVGGAGTPYVRSLAVYDEGTGPSLFAAGAFTTAGAASVNNIARWDVATQTWADVGGGLSGSVVEQLAAFDDGDGPALFATGGFVTGGSVPARFVAQWRGCGPGAPGTAFCSGDGSGTPCPCANNGASGNGCASSVNAVGAHLGATGTAHLAQDSLVLAGSGMPNAPALYFQGTAAQNNGLGSTFGDGLRCVAGTIIRLGTKANVAGASQYPASGDASVSVRGLVTQPGTRRYQVWYRNAAAFCTPSTFNLTNGLRVLWTQ